LNRNFITIGRISLFVLIGLAGVIVGRISAPATKVNAQEKFSGITDCTAVVPKSWGEFKGASEYGLAFQDENGVVRFLLHPACTAVNSPTDPPPAAIDLEVKRR
jgi:hypothetical protein